MFSLAALSAEEGLNRSLGFTLIEILMVVAIIALLAVIAVPSGLRARLTVNEVKVVEHLHALGNALVMHHSVNQSYPAQWQQDMYTTPDPDFGPASFNMDIQDADGVMQGYAYRYIPGAGTPQVYSLNAHPLTNGVTGGRSFWLDETGEIYHCLGDNASADRPAAVTSLIHQQPVICP